MDYSLPLIVEHDHEDVLLTELAKLNNLLEDAPLSFAVGHAPKVVTFNVGGRVVFHVSPTI